MLIAADLQRPAAVEQLKVLAKQNNIESFSIDNCLDPVKVVKDGIKFSSNSDNEIIVSYERIVSRAATQP